MLALETVEKTEITLKGSVEIVSEFFFTAINSILYQRGTWVKNIDSFSLVETFSPNLSIQNIAPIHSLF